MSVADGPLFNIVVLVAFGIFIIGFLAKLSEELRKRR